MRQGNLMTPPEVGSKVLVEIFGNGPYKATVKGFESTSVGDFVLVHVYIGTTRYHIKVLPSAIKEVL